MEGGGEATASEEEKMIKTYRGSLANGGEDQLRLSTIKGKVGYQITKFQIVGAAPGAITQEAVVQIFKSSTTPSGTVNFSDSDLLAVAVWRMDAQSTTAASQTIIFDQEVFNQDIFIGATDTHGGSACNYYLELEVIPLDDAGAEYTTLKDLRQPG